VWVLIHQETVEKRKIRSRFCLLYNSDLWIDFYFPLFHPVEKLSIKNMNFIGGSYVNNFLGNLKSDSSVRVYADYIYTDHNNNIPHLEIYFFQILKNGRTQYEILDLSLSERDRVCHVLTACTDELLKQTHVKPIHKNLYEHMTEVLFIPKSSSLSQSEIYCLLEKHKNVDFPDFNLLIKNKPLCIEK